MKIINTVTVAQLISWLIFIMGDYLEETYSNDLLLAVALLILPIALPVLYLIFQSRVHYSDLPKWVNTVTVLGVWTVDNILLYALTMGLIGSNLWLIPQAADGWEHFLNGIEYLLFPFFNIAAAFIIVLLWNLILLLKQKLSG